MSDGEKLSLKWLLRAVWMVFIALVAIIVVGIYNYGRQEERLTAVENAVQDLQENCIDETTWRYNDYFTRYLWAERWSQSLPNPPYNERGVAPNL